MSAHVLLNLLNESGKTIRCEAFKRNSAKFRQNSVLAVHLKTQHFDLHILW